MNRKAQMLFIGLTVLTGGSVFSQISQLTQIIEPGSDQYFERILTAEEDVLVINGFQDGEAVFIYLLDENSDEWIYDQTVFPPVGESFSNFGNAAAISEDYLVVGAFTSFVWNEWNSNFQQMGKVVIYKKNESGIWEFFQTLSELSTDEVWMGFQTYPISFGFSVAIKGEAIIVGANYMNLDSETFPGAAFFYNLNGGGVWELSQILYGSTPGIEDNFGIYVLFTDDQLLISAYEQDTDENGANYIEAAGAVYVFEENAQGDWEEVQKIVSPQRTEYGTFGHTLAIGGENLIVGSPFESNPAHTFQRNVEGIWELDYTLSYDLTNPVPYPGKVELKFPFAFLEIFYDDNTSNVVCFIKENETWEQLELIAPTNWTFYPSALKTNNSFLFASYPGENESKSIYIFNQFGALGKVFKDLDSDCSYDPTDGHMGQMIGQIEPGGAYVTTNQLGYWNWHPTEPGNYTLTFPGDYGSWTANCGNEISFEITDINAFIHTESLAMESDEFCASPLISVFANSMRPCFVDQRLYIQACNNFEGSASMENPYVQLKLDEQITPGSSNIPYTTSGEYLVFQLDDLGPGDCNTINLDFFLSCDALLGSTICTEAQLYPVAACALDTSTIHHPEVMALCESEYDGSNLMVETWCENDSIKFSIENISPTPSGDMSCFAHVRFYQDGLPLALDSVILEGGGIREFAFEGDGKTWRIEVDQHPLKPGLSSPSTSIEACGPLENWVEDLVNVFPHDDLDEFRSIYCALTTSSYDPNIKSSVPVGIGEFNHIAPSGMIEYYIQFQNTGSDTAFTVVLRDTLDQNLNLYSVNPGVASHPYQFEVTGDRVLKWTFNNILLPDSATNPEGSNGFATFKVNQENELPEGTGIQNAVAIYFDFNEPIITNTVNLTVFYDINVLSVHDVAGKNKRYEARIFPNPAENNFQISIDGFSDWAEISIMRINGQVVSRSRQYLDQNVSIMSSLPTGIYIIRIEGGDLQAFGKLIIQ